MNKHENAEIVVIGGGAVGTAVACYLARDGADVALVERGEYAWGSSRRCDGHAVTYDSAPGYFSQFCKIGQDMFPEISRELPCDIEFEPEGLGLLVDDERDMETVLANYEGKKNEGVDVTFWDRDELLRHEPHVSDKVIACLNFNGDAKLNPMRLCFGLAELARQKGAKAFNRTAVTGITVKNGAVQSVDTSSGSIATKGFAWPMLDGMVSRTVPVVPAETPYAAFFKFGWLSAGGTAILLSGFFAVPFMPKYSFGKAVACFFSTIYQLRFPVLTIATILGLAFLMNYSGMSTTLGIGFTKTGSLFPFFAPILGWLGVFLTGSDTSSNALFCGMQRSTAQAVGMPPELAVAVNSSGGVTGKMISPQSISVATAATGMIGQEGNLFRFALGHSIAMTLFICVLTYLQATVWQWMLP